MLLYINVMQLYLVVKQCDFEEHQSFAHMTFEVFWHSIEELASILQVLTSDFWQTLLEKQYNILTP